MKRETSACASHCNTDYMDIQGEKEEQERKKEWIFRSINVLFVERHRRGDNRKYSKNERLGKG